MTSTYDIEIKQGATFTLSFNWKNKKGVLYDLTNYTASMMIRTDYDSATYLVSLTSAGGDITLGGTAGTVIAKISPTATALLDANDFPAVYDLEITSTLDPTIVIRLLEGNVTLRPNVTRPDV